MSVLNYSQFSTEGVLKDLIYPKMIFTIRNEKELAVGEAPRKSFLGFSKSVATER